MRLGQRAVHEDPTVPPVRAQNAGTTRTADGIGRPVLLELNHETIVRSADGRRSGVVMMPRHVRAVSPEDRNFLTAAVYAPGANTVQDVQQGSAGKRTDDMSIN